MAIAPLHSSGGAFGVDPADAAYRSPDVSTARDSVRFVGQERTGPGTKRRAWHLPVILVRFVL